MLRVMFSSEIFVNKLRGAATQAEKNIILLALSFMMHKLSNDILSNPNDTDIETKVELMKYLLI